MLNKCKKTQNLIFDYIDGVLPSCRQKYVKKHLETCDKCNIVLKECLELKEQLNSVNLAELPQDFHSKLHLKLARENTLKSKQVWLPAVATAVTAALLALIVFNANFMVKLPEENQNIVYNEEVTSKSRMTTNDVMFDATAENLKAEITGTFVADVSNTKLFEYLDENYKLTQDGEYYVIDCTKVQFEEIKLFLLQNDIRLEFEQDSKELKIRIKK